MGWIWDDFEMSGETFRPRIDKKVDGRRGKERKGRGKERRGEGREGKERKGAKGRSTE